MKEISNLDLLVYNKKLDNGLDVIIIPNNKVNNTYCTYTTKYGGKDIEFYKDDKLISTPKGIAHFLEHKMFEMEDEIDVFNYFSERGSNCNANTNGEKTTYLFSGPNLFYENLEFLLKYVEEPYFTDENVEKEKGIIIQELLMYRDNPYARLFEEIMYNTLIEHPLRFPTIGTKESIESITKEDLYDCYNTFYHPSNMFLVITGNVDPKKTFELIEEHENKRNLKPEKIIKRKEYEEPDTVYKKDVEITMPVTIPKIAICFKVNIKNMKYHKNDIKSCLYNAFDLMFGNTSIFAENIKNEGLITDSFDTTIIDCEDHLIVIIDFETTSDYNLIIEKVLEKIKHLEINEKEFERRKKTNISGLVLTSDNIFNLNGNIIKDIITRGEIVYNPIEKIKKFKFNDAKKIINNINLDNYSIIKILPKEV